MPTIECAPSLPARITLPTRLVTSASSRPADSDAPIASVDVASLSCGRFLLQKQRLLPYRDEQGRINIHLLQRSLDEIAAGAATCDAKTHANAKAWLRHGLQALAGHAAHRGSGPDADEDDESLTLEQLLDAELRRTATSGGGGGGARPPALPQTVQQGSRHIPRKRLRAFSPLFPEPNGATAIAECESEQSSGRSDGLDEGAGGSAAGDSAAGDSGSEREPVVGVLDTDAESGDDVYEVAEVPRRLFAEAWPRCFRPALGGGSGRRAGGGGAGRGVRGSGSAPVRDGCARSPQHV